MASWVLWSALVLCGYTYGGYLLVLVLMDAVRSIGAHARRLSGPPARPREVADEDLPTVSVLVAAHNEEAVIRQKLENTLALDYPREKLEILLGSDGSSDRTDEIVRGFADRGVKLSAAPRAGKSSVLNRLAEQATGRLWLFTDANTMIEPDALRRMVLRFEDSSVGAVCGRLRLVGPDGAPQTESLYWRYENLLKFYESRLGTLMGANGGLYLLRRGEWRPLGAEIICDDFLATMRVVADRGRVVYEPDAVAEEETASDLAGEARRRVRIAAGNFQALRELWPVALRLDFAAFALWSHKLLRWMAPFLLALALGANLMLVHRPFYAALFAAQLLFYFAALVPLPGRLGRAGSIARYFVEMNWALVLGLVRHLRGSQTAVWQRTARTSPGRRAA